MRPETEQFEYEQTGSKEVHEFLEKGKSYWSDSLTDPDYQVARILVELLDWYIRLSPYESR